MLDRFLRLVQDKCLLVVAELEKHRVYMEDNVRLDNAILNRSSKRHFDHDRLGGKPIFAFDQSTRLLAILHGLEVCCIFLSLCIFSNSI